MRLKLSFAAVALAAAAAGCDRDDNIADESVEMPPPSVAIANDQRAAEVVGPDAEETAGGIIPQLLQGRWGLTPMDCTSPSGEAEGLLVVTSDALRFHESVARPVSDIDTTADSISGTFAFVGEGQRRTAFQALEIKDGKLIRTETEPAAAHSYVRC